MTLVCGSGRPGCPLRDVRQYVFLDESGDHRPVAAAEDAGGHVSRTACGRFLVPFQMAAQGPAQVEAGGHPLGCFHLGDSGIRLVSWEVKGR